MADTPVPYSLSEILGDMLEAFVSGTGISVIKLADPILSTFESAAQSDLRASEDIFTLLESNSLDYARGVALDRIAASEGIARKTEGPASGFVTVSDASFEKISSKVFQGTAAPIVGSSSINVPDASSFPASGSVYIGRSTSNYEGPLAYTSILPPGVGGGFSGGSYYTLVLASNTTQFHNVGESVILAQGGDREVSAGSVVQTAQGNSATAAQFRVLYRSTILDGEVSVENVTVVATKPGISGNIQAKTIKGFVTAPFSGATCTNPSPFINGQSAEGDDALRERVRLARATRVRGTSLALQTFATGVTSLDENKRVLSASVIARRGSPSVVVIDDGTGYEEKDEGIAIESFTDLAFGGETRFKVTERPVAKAYVVTELVAPFNLATGQKLAFEAGGKVGVHTLDAARFRAINNATAYELVSSINSDYALSWGARTYDNGTRVAVFAKADTSEWVQNIPVVDAVDANQFLGFSLRRVDTMSLYKNDRLLVKDGALAQVSSLPTSNWATLGSTETLALSVDGTSLSNLVSGTYTFTAQDFINASTGYSSVGRNSPEAWAKVFEYRIPGISAKVVNGIIVLTSNAGLNDRARLSVDVTNSSLVAKGMFAATEVAGSTADYVLDRNTGELELAVPLSAGDVLTAGTTNTRSFLETDAFTTFSITGSAAQFWFAGDADAQLIEHGVSAANPLTFSDSAAAWGVRQRMAGVAGTFSNVLTGDWLVFWDTAAPAALLNGTYRVATVESNGAWVEFERPTAATPGVYTFTTSGLSVVRTLERLQQATLPVANNYTADGVAIAFNAALSGIESETYRTKALRVRTTSFGDNGDVALVAVNVKGQALGLETSDSQPNQASHLGSVESGNSDVGTPDFHVVEVTSASGAGDPTVFWSDSLFSSPDYDAMLVGLRSVADGTLTTQTRYGQDNGRVTAIGDIAANAGNWDLDVRTAPPFYTLNDRYYLASSYRLGPDDELAITADGDTEQKRFIIPMWRTLKTVGTTYAATSAFKDADNGNQSLAYSFGYTGAEPFNFDDFAVYMAARVKTHNTGSSFSSLTGLSAFSTAYNTPVNNQATTARTLLWRYHRLGPDGEKARLRFGLPDAPDQTATVLTDTSDTDWVNLTVRLPSGNLSTGYTLPNNYKVGTVATSTTTGMTKVYYILAFPVESLSRTGGTTVNFTLTMPTGVVHSGLDLTGATSYYFVSNTVNLATGNYALNGEVLSGGTFKVVTCSSAGANFGPDANAGTLYLVTSTTASLSGATPAIVRGSFLRVDGGSGLPAAYKDITVRIQNDISTNPFWVECVIENFTGSVTDTPTYSSVGTSSLFAVFQNPQDTAASIVTAINAQTGLGAYPTLLGDGTMQIDRSSAEDAAVANTWYQLTDGLNYVKTTTVPGSLAADYQFTFKKDITASLATNSDWANEVVKIVPRTTVNVVDWLNRPSVSGLFSACEVKASSGSRKVQVASLTPGSAGSVEVQGGTANSATATVVGSSLVTGNRMVCTVDETDLTGFQGLAWVSVDNAEVLPKNVFGTTTVLNSIVNDTATTSKLTLSAATDFYTEVIGPSPSVVFQVEQQGRFVALVDTGLGDSIDVTNVAEGQWLRVTAPATPTYVGGAVETVAAGNIGIYRVVRVANHVGRPPTIWIENNAVMPQALAEADVAFYTDDSVMPGDILSISNTAWDGSTPNKGRYEVVDVGNSFTNPQVLTVSGTLATVGSPKPALGSSYEQIQVLEAAPCRLIKRILSIAPNEDTGFADIKFTTSAVAKRVGGAAGSVLTALDKLDFELGIARGVDGYRHQTGLLAEVNRVLYGDPADSSTYPGVVAAGSAVNIQGPLVKRIQVTLSLRIKTGSNRERVRNWARSAVASVINQTPIGEAISLSDLTAAAGRVGGVVSATMVSPVATAGNDVISVQDYEKPLVLDVDTDVIITFVGE